jgi:hypothetical protein
MQLALAEKQEFFYKSFLSPGSAKEFSTKCPPCTKKKIESVITELSSIRFPTLLDFSIENIGRGLALNRSTISLFLSSLPLSPHHQVIDESSSTVSAGVCVWSFHLQGVRYRGQATGPNEPVFVQSPSHVDFSMKHRTALRGAAAWLGGGRFVEEAELLKAHGGRYRRKGSGGDRQWTQRRKQQVGKRTGTGRTDEGKRGTRTGTRKKNRCICTDTNCYPVRDATL